MVLGTIAAISAFLGVLMVVMALGRRREDPLRSRLGSLAARTWQDNEGPDLALPFSQRIIWPIFDSLGRGLAKLLPTTLATRIRRLLMLAGQPFSLAGFLTLTVLTGLATSGAFVLLLLLLDVGFGTLQLLGLLSFAAIGLYVPYFWLARRVRQRQESILKSLPNALDLITTCVEAGLGLDSAFAKVAERQPGPFGEELTQALREMALGRSRRDALRDVGERTGLTPVITFVNAIIHAETTGSSIGDVLRAQADQMRTHRRQHVEQVAQRMPVWMTFPLVLFLLPSLFIAILGPAGIQVIESLTE